MHGARGEASSTGETPNNPPGRGSTRALDDCPKDRPNPRTRISVSNEPISPPHSPRPHSHLQPIEFLVNQLRKQSLKQQAEAAAERSEPAAALSPQSLPDDDFPSLPADHNDMSMDIDACHEETRRLMRSSGQGRLASASLDKILDMISSGDQCNIHPSPGSSTPLIADPDPELFYPSVSDHDLDDLPPLEVDEGFCDEDDMSWLDSCVSLRTASGPGGVTKHYGLRYRTSAEVASRCSNLVHNIPRMRRRDKTTRRR